ELQTADPKAHRKAIEELLSRVSRDADPEAVEKTRRALASEIQRLIDRITIEPSHVLPPEVIEVRASDRVPALQTLEQIESNLKSYSFELKIKYRNGDVEHIEGWRSGSLRLKRNPRMTKLILNRKISLGQEAASAIADD